MAHQQNYWITPPIEGVGQFMTAVYGPFRNQNQLRFTDLHIPQNNMISYGIVPGGLIYRKTLRVEDVRGVSLRIVGENDILPQVNPDNMFLRSWDPYLRQWWYFGYTDFNGRISLRRGWKEFCSTHRLETGDAVEFMLATVPFSLPDVTFVVVRPVFASRGIPHYRHPYRYLV